MTDKALKGNKLTKRFHLNVTSLETPDVQNKKRLELMYKKAEERRKDKKNRQKRRGK